MKTVITYGTFDLLHKGHLRLLERAKALGDYLIVGVTSDQYDKARGKLNVSQSTLERVDAVRATGLADVVILEEYEGQKIDDIIRYNVDIFTVGSDWRGAFDYLSDYCDVVYLDRTQGISSSEIRSFNRRLRVGMVGGVSYLSKFLRESAYVDGVEVVGVFWEGPNPIPPDLEALPLVARSYNELISNVDAAYLISPPASHFKQISKALGKGIHVLCESPLVLDPLQVEELHALAQECGCQLIESLRTAYSDAFHYLLLLVKGGIIGDVVAIDATCTSLRSVDLEADFTRMGMWNSICAWGPAAMLPVFQLMGTEYETKHIMSQISSDEIMYDEFTRVVFVFESSVATITVGQGVKSEGSLVVSGTKGYVYVPSPWWKTEYFEIRFENAADNKRYFYKLDGEGIREELVSFVKAVNGMQDAAHIEPSISKAIARVLADYYSGKGLRRLERK